MLPEYLTRMVRRQMPSGCGVVLGSTPVVSFGNPQISRVATLGINPSRKEFLDDNGNLLRGRDQRFETLSSVGADRCEALTDSQIISIIEGCNNYFKRRPYMTWFKPLERIIETGAAVSYRVGTACHLDLVQWATDPVWGKMPTGDAKKALMEEGIEHLRAQLTTENIETIIVVSGEVWKQLEIYGLCKFEDVEVMRAGKKGQIPCTLRIGEGCGSRFVGWTSNVQSQPGITRQDQDSLGRWLKSVTARAS